MFKYSRGSVRVLLQCFYPSGNQSDRVRFRIYGINTFYTRFSEVWYNNCWYGVETEKRKRDGADWKRERKLGDRKKCFFKAAEISRMVENKGQRADRNRRNNSTAISSNIFTILKIRLSRILEWWGRERRQRKTEPACQINLVVQYWPLASRLREWLQY